MLRCNSGLVQQDTVHSRSHQPDRAEGRACGTVLDRLVRVIWAALIFGTVAATAARGQTRRETVRTPTLISGLVTDPSGAVVRGARVSLVRQADGTVVSTATSGTYGVYRLDGGTGTYRVNVSAPGFATFQSPPIVIHASRANVQVQVDVMLQIATVLADVEVPEGTAETAVNGRDLVLKGRAVQQLPLDAVALQEVLASLAGSSSAEILVDGFSGGKLPSRNSIREIRINQNPYSADNDTDTATGVIQVLTQPGTNQLHGYAYVYGDHSSLNAANPFAEEQPPYYADGAGGELTGSIGTRTNAYGTIEDLQQRTNSAVDALVLDSGLGLAPALYTVPNPRTSVNAAARLDAKLAENNTLIARYSLEQVKQSNVDVGQLSLLSQGLNESTLTHTLQMSDTVVVNAGLVAETRLQYIRARLEQTPVNTAPTVVVEGAFTGGGNARGELEDHQDRLELQTAFSVAGQKHFLHLGGRLRLTRDASVSRSNFNGQLIFSSLDAYGTTLSGLAAGQSATAIAAAGGGASQYVIAQGDPNATVTLIDGAGFVDDTWRLSRNLKVSYGLRFETQNLTGDQADWAPRVGFSWGLGTAGRQGVPKYVLHGGAGIFYQRFGTDQALQVRRFDGIRVRQEVVESPQLCLSGMGMLEAESCGAAAPFATPSRVAAAGTVYRVGEGYQAPYVVEASAGIERQLNQRTSVRASYLHSRGVHMPYAENANAPLPGTYSVGNPSTGIRPEGSQLNVFEYESEGVWRRRQLTTGVLVRGSRFSVTANYMLQFSNDDTENDGVFPLNRFNKRIDYGRSNSDQRHVLTLNGSLNLPYGISSWTYLRAASGAPLNIVVGQDLNGDTQFNDRPAFATDLTRASVVRTAFGAFDTKPVAGQTLVPRNYGQGPGLLTLNVEMGKQFGFGPRVSSATSGRPGERRYSAELQVLALNALNHPNLAQPVPLVDSPLFGRSVGVISAGSLSPSRCFDMQLMVRF